MLTKLALLLLLVAVVFYGGKALARLGQGIAAERSPGRDDKPSLQPCPRCQAYVVGGRCDCGRSA